MRWWILWLAAWMLSGCAQSGQSQLPLAGATTAETLATVNGARFTRADLDKRTALVQLVTWLTTGRAPSELYESQYVDQWIDSELMAQAAARAGFNATEGEAQQEIARLLAEGKLDETDLLRQLGVQGLARAELVQYEQRALSVQHFVDTNVLVGVSDIEKPGRLLTWLVRERGSAMIEKPTPVGTTPMLGVNAGAFAPNFTLTTLDGSELSLDAMRGTALLVNFWASWCVPCRKEMPAIQQLYNSHKDQSFVVWGVNVGETRDQIESYAQELGLSFPLLLDDDSKVTHRYRVFGLPTSVFIDRNGVIQAVVIGEMSKEILQSNVARLLR